MNSSYDAPWARPIPKAVKWLLIVTVGVWIFLQMLLGELLGLRLTGVLALVPGDVLFEGWIWQLFTYPFLHSLSVTHILLNMLMLWMIGSELEMRWGARRFFAYYLGSAVGAGVLYTLGVWAYSSVRGETAALAVPVVGASGGIFALLLAYGILFGERVLSFFLLFPMKAKYFVLILGVVEVMTLLSVGVMGGQVATLAHLGGLVSGMVGLAIMAQVARRQKNAKAPGAKARSSKLRLVVDNESPKGPPKYWN